jgi:DNA-binding transcriptional regulator YhcF (GntR family)
MSEQKTDRIKQASNDWTAWGDESFYMDAKKVCPDIVTMELAADLSIAFESVHRAAWLAGAIRYDTIRREGVFTADDVIALSAQCDRFRDALGKAVQSLNVTEQSLVQAQQRLKGSSLPMFNGRSYRSAHTAAVAYANRTLDALGVAGEQLAADHAEMWRAITERLWDVPQPDARAIVDAMVAEAIEADVAIAAADTAKMADVAIERQLRAARSAALREPQEIRNDHAIRIIAESLSKIDFSDLATSVDRCQNRRDQAMELVVSAYQHGAFADPKYAAWVATMRTNPTFGHATGSIHRAGVVLREEQYDDLWMNTARDEIVRMMLDTPAIAKKSGKGMSVEDAVRLAENHIKNGNPWPGVRSFARMLRCSASTLSNAVERSPLLQQAKSAAEGGTTVIPSKGKADVVETQLERLVAKRSGSVDPLHPLELYRKKLIAAAGYDEKEIEKANQYTHEELAAFKSLENEYAVESRRDSQPRRKRREN